MREDYPKNQEWMHEYFRPMTRWADAFQNGYAARADWCVKSFKEANHPPVVKLYNALNIEVKPNNEIKLSAKGAFDPDNDKLSYTWWHYEEASTYLGSIEISNSNSLNASFQVPNDAKKGETFHIVCEVKDNGIPQRTRYQRVIVTVQ